jgi:hypothetical protein
MSGVKISEGLPLGLGSLITEGPIISASNTYVEGDKGLRRAWLGEPLNFRLLTEDD